MHPVVATWLHPRRKRFWAIFAVVFYTLFGFYGLPAILRAQLPAIAQEQVKRPLTVGEVTFNPYLFKLTVNALELRDTDDTRLAGLDRLYVDFELRSIIDGAFSFADLQVDGVYLMYERFKDGSSRLQNMLDDMPPAEPSAEPEQEQGGLPALVFDRLRINRGEMLFVDDVPVETYRADIGPIDIAVDNLSTLPNDTGDQSISIVLDGNKTLTWTGELGLQPLQSRGHISFSGEDPSRSLAYLKNSLDLSDFRMRFDAEFDYDLEIVNDELQVGVSALDVYLDDILFTGLTPSRELLGIDRLALTGGALKWPQASVTIEKIAVEGPRTAFTLNEDGSLDLAALVRQPGDEAVADPEADEDSGASIDLAIAALEVSSGRVRVTETALDPLRPLDLESIDLVLRDLSLAPDAAMPLSFSAQLAQGGVFGADGELTVLPEPAVSLNASVSSLPLELAEPYLKSFVRIDIASGELNLQSKLAFAGDALKASGGLTVDALNITNAKGTAEVIRWQQLAIKNFEFDQVANTVNTSELVLTSPSGRFHIAADGTNNIGDLMVEAAADDNDEAMADADAEADTPASAAPHVTLVGLKIKDGRLDFADESLPLPFATDINSLEGRLSTIDSIAREPVRLEFAGHVADYGMARINGRSILRDALASTNITMEFRNIKLGEYTPYSVQFAGRKIDSGDMDITLGYAIENSQMKGNNEMVIKDFKLGEKVDQPGAMDLPLDLAVALLTDADGTIDLALPVSGDVGNPAFDFGETISKVLGNILTKMVTAPFRLLGSLVGAGEKDLGHFEFLPGRADLTPPEREQARKLADALAQRPQIKLEIKPGVDEASDGAALRLKAVETKILERYGMKIDELRANLMLDGAFEDFLQEMYLELAPAETLEQVQARYTTTNEAGEWNLDRLAYLQELFDIMVRMQPLDPAAMSALAAARAENIRAEMMASGLDDASRVAVGETQKAKLDGDWVVTELGAIH